MMSGPVHKRGTPGIRHALFRSCPKSKVCGSFTIMFTINTTKLRNLQRRPPEVTHFLSPTPGIAWAYLIGFFGDGKGAGDLGGSTPVNNPVILDEIPYDTQRIV